MSKEVRKGSNLGIQKYVLSIAYNLNPIVAPSAAVKSQG